MKKTLTILLVNGGRPDVVGLIPSFLRADDPRPARDQFNERYISGWSPMKGFTMDPTTGELHYPGDPPLKPRACIAWRSEGIWIYDSGWVAIVQDNGDYEVSRMD